MSSTSPVTEPRGAKGYGKLFERECDRFQRVWPVSLTIQPTDFDSGDFARWRVDARASHWQVSTTYDFLRLERFIRSDLNEPLVRHIPRALGWVIGDLVSGALLRIFLASWRFGQILFVQLVLLAWLVSPPRLARRLDTSSRTILVRPRRSALAGACLPHSRLSSLLQPVARRFGAIQIPSCWATLRRFARGQATGSMRLSISVRGAPWRPLRAMTPMRLPWSDTVRAASSRRRWSHGA
jgi:hypothetical protein